MCKTWPLLNRSSKLTRGNKLLIYKTLIRPIITYAAPVWSNTCKTNYNKLQIVQNKCLRMAGSFSRDNRMCAIHNYFNIQTIEDFVFKQTYNFYMKCEKNTYSSIISNLGLYSRSSLNLMYKKYKHKRPMHILLQK